jgi:hypothetical protein
VEGVRPVQPKDRGGTSVRCLVVMAGRRRPFGSRSLRPPEVSGRPVSARA